MSDANKPKDIYARVAALESQLATLRRTSQLASSAIKNGNLAILDGSGNTRVTLGKIGSNYGLQLLGPTGQDSLTVTDASFQQTLQQGSLAITDDSGRVRLRVGKQADNAYVGRGWDASGEGVNSPQWDTGFDQLKVVQTGTQSVTKAANSNNQQGSITHNLGYIPVFLVYFNSPSSGQVAVPYQEMNIDLDQTARLTSLLSVFCHSTTATLYFEIACGSSGSYFTNSLTVNFRYYLLTETGT